MRQLLVLTVIYLIFTEAKGHKDDEGPLVASTTQGHLRGKWMHSKGGRKFGAFLGIPYAKPPIDELRFKPPVPGDSWDGIRNATKTHPICPQRDIYRRATLIEGQEDCLYLNVYTPELNPTKVHPVMVFFHGGGWLCGGGNNLWYGPNVLLDRDVVLVVTNYRLGAFGFLSTGDAACSGNNGLKDQNLALKWVQDNIGNFGGDANSVTLFGESAGGASVHYHMLSPMSKGLFHRGISQSGTALCPWAIAAPQQGVHNSKKLANYLNCPTSPSERMLACLRKIDAYKIVSQDRAFMQWDTDPMIPFKPVVEYSANEDTFLSEHPISAVQAGRIANVPWMVGLNTEDGALRTAGIAKNPYLLNELSVDFNEITPVALEYDLIAANVDGVTKQIRDFYFGQKEIGNKTVDRVTDMFTDGWFLFGADQAAHYHSNVKKQSVFYYLFGYRGLSSFTEIFGDPHHNYGVCHADELQYLFPMDDGLFKKPLPEHDRKMMKIMTDLWVDFATTGNPTPETNDNIPEKWLPLQSDNMEYYYIDAKEMGMRQGLLLDRAKFWRELPIFSKGQIRDEL